MMRLKRRTTPNPAAHRYDLDLPSITAAARGLLGSDAAVRPLWNYETGALEVVEVRTPRSIARIPGILTQLTSRVTNHLGEHWICERATDDPDAIRIAKAETATLQRAGLGTITETLNAGAASLGNPSVQPTYAPDGALESVDILFSPGRKVDDHVLSDYATTAMPGRWSPSWPAPDRLRLTPRP
ncbi:hypothetical protein ACFV9C_42615 [Kribbella sp. NPDC059898]|uniref:hypothetical protein n=1 Tax=Kribbella sp. NPDC059898 TaxID=3346995 RepID=UPI0036552567